MSGNVMTTLSGGELNRTVFQPGAVLTCFLCFRCEVLGWWRFYDGHISVVWRHEPPKETEP